MARKIARDLYTGGVFINGVTASDPGAVRWSKNGYGQSFPASTAAFVNPQTVWIEFVTRHSRFNHGKRTKRDSHVALAERREDGVSMSKTAFIGLGAMGSPMAANLLKAGHEVTVCDLNPEAVKTD